MKISTRFFELLRMIVRLWSNLPLLVRLLKAWKEGSYRGLSVRTLASCAAALLYVLSPVDLIPDFIPVLGYLDDLIIVPLGILAVVQLIPPEIMAEHRATAAVASERPVSRSGAVVIVLIWAASIAIIAWLGYRFFGRWK